MTAVDQARRSYDDGGSAQTFIDRAIVVGDGRPYVAALLFVDEAALRAYADKRGIEHSTRDELVANLQIHRHVQSLINDVNLRPSRPEQIKRFALIAEPLSVQSGALTPTFKVRRHVVVQNHRHSIDAFYAQPGSPSHQEIS